MDFLTAKQIIQTGNYDCLYAFMYGSMFDNGIIGADRSIEVQPAKIIKLEKRDVELDRKGLGFFFVWGFPGPDYNYYLYTDYNYSWSFSEDELLFAQKNEWEKWQRGTCLSTEETRAIMDAAQFIQGVESGKSVSPDPSTVGTLMHILEKTTHKLI